MKRRRFLRLLVTAALAALPFSLAGPAAHADSPLPAPTNLQALHVSDTAADLDWLSSGLTSGDVVQREVGGAWTQYATGAFGYLPLTGLGPGTTYTFRVYSVPYAGLGYTTSPPSAPISFTTLSGPDTVPPSTPAAPTFTSVTTTMATAFWPEATDNVEVTGYYLQQLIGGTWTTVRTLGPADRSPTLTGLTAATAYSFAVIAFDARGNLSARSNPGTFTTLALTAQPTCLVQTLSYTTTFETTVTITNTTAAPLNGWTVQFSLPASASVNSAFNGVVTRNGTTDTIAPAFYDAVIGTGGQLFVGFGGSDSPLVTPSAFSLDTVPCSVG